MTVEDLKEALEAFIKNELPELQKMEDYYSGTMYIPLRNGNFLAYDFNC